MPRPEPVKIRSFISCVVIFFSLLSVITVFAQTNQVVTGGSSTSAVIFPVNGCTYNWANDRPGIGLPASGTGNIASFTAINNGAGPVVATITATPVPAGFGYIANYADGTVSVINTSTNTEAAKISVGAGPVGVAISPDNSHVYISNLSDGTVSVINTATNTITATIAVGYTNATQKSTPFGIAISPDGSRVYVAAGNPALPSTISVINTATNAVISTIVAGATPQGLAISPDGLHLYEANRLDHTVSVVNTGTGVVEANIPVGSNPMGITASPDGKYVYVANFDDGTISAINTVSNTATTFFTDAGGLLYGVALSPDGGTLYTTNPLDNTIYVVNTATRVLQNVISVGALAPQSITVGADGSTVYVANTNSGSVSAISTATGMVTGTVKVGNSPVSLGNFIAGSSACNSSPVTFTITVNPAPPGPVVTVSTASGAVNACVGTASASPNIQNFSVSGINLTGHILATVPPGGGFEVSLTPGGGYSSSVSISPTGGTVNNTTVFVRSAASAATGNISGNIAVTSPGAAGTGVAVTGTINPLPTVDQVSDETYNNNDVTKPITFSGTSGSFSWVNNTPGIGLAANGTGSIPSFTAVNTGASPVTATITVTPIPTGFEYIANAGSDNVSVINATSNMVIATIAVGAHPVGVSVTPDGGRVYITNQNAKSVSVINTTTNAVLSTITVGTNPTGVVASRDGSRVYVANAGDNTVSVINTATNAVISTINVGQQPTGLAASPDGRYIYVTNYKDQSISVINTATKTVSSTIPVGAGPVGIAVSNDGSQLFVSNDSAYFIIISTATQLVTAKILLDPDQLPQVGPAGVVVSPDGKFVFVADENAYAVAIITLIGTPAILTFARLPFAYPYGLSISPDGLRLYAVTPLGAVSAIDVPDALTGNSLEVVAATGVGTNPESIGNFFTYGSGCTGTPITFTIRVNPTPATITAGLPSGVMTACAGTASASPNIQQFTVSGNTLTTDITATAPPGGEFEVSLSAAGGYANSVNLRQTNGTLSNTVVYVRSSSTAAAGGISGNVALTTAGATTQNVAVAGIINALPTVNAVASQSLINGSATTAITFTGTGDTYSWVNDSPAIGLAANGTGDIPSFNVVNTGAITVTAIITVTPGNSKTGCAGAPVTFVITVNPTPRPVITATGGPSAVSTIYGAASAASSITISGTNMKAGILVTPPPGFEVSTDNINFSNTVTVGGAGAIASTAVYIRLAKTTTTGGYAGNIVLTSAGGANVNVIMPTSTVEPAPLTVTANNINKIYGTAITGGPGSTAFTISGLQNGETAVTVTITYLIGAAAGDNGGTYAMVVVPSAVTGGTFTAGNYTITYIPGDISVAAVPLAITADSKRKVVGADNPVLTVTYIGFINGDGPGQLTTPPVITTTATVSSPPGQYPITATGAFSPNYNIIYVDGVLTVTPLNPVIIVPNTFTPNGDGINDTWNIANVNFYANCTVNVFSRYGETVFSSIGYGVAWDGTYNGKPLPTGTYYYIVDLKNGSKVSSGWVAIIR